MNRFISHPSYKQPSIKIIVACAFVLSFSTQCFGLRHGVAVNNVGEMYFYQHTREIHFSLNQLVYIENAQLLIQNMGSLLETCNQTLSTANCRHFSTNLKHNIAQLKRDITFIKSRKSVQKRAIFIPILAGTAIYSAISFISQAKKSIREKRNIAFDKIDHIEKQLMLIKNTVETSQEAIQDLMNILKRNQEKIRELDDTMNKMNEFYEMLHITSSMLETHQIDMSKLESFFNGHIKDNFLRIIDIMLLEEQVEIINTTLNDQFSLPPTSIFDIINMAKIYTAVNITHFTIIIKIPILNKQCYSFQEFIPVPVTHDNDTIIININSSYFIQDNDENIRIVPEDILEDCFTLNKLIICNSLIRDSFLDPDNCVNALLKYDSNKFCGNKIIEKKNYFIRISTTALFIYAAQPLELKILCGLEERIFNFTNDNLINFSEFCELLEYSRDELNDSSILSSEIYTPVFQPILRLFNTSESKWMSNFEILNKTNIKFLEILNQTEPLFEHLHELKKENKKSFWSFITDPFNKLMDSIGDSIGGIPRMMIEFVLCYIILPLTLFYVSFQLILITIKKLICRRSS